MSWLRNFLSSGFEIVADLVDDFKDATKDLWQDARTGDFTSVVSLALLLLVPLVIGVVVVAVVLAIVFAILDPPPEKGTVRDKDYTPAYSTTQCSTVDKTTTCYPVYHPDYYAFDLYDGDDHGWREVDPGTYGRYPVGSYYPGE